MSLNKTIINKGQQVHLAATVSAHNSTMTALDAGATFTGEFEDVLGFTSVMMAIKTDQDYTVYVDFSPDGVNVDSTLTYVGAAGINEVHRLVVTRRYFRLRIVNGSVAQSYLRAQITLGYYDILVSPANATLQQDADAITAKVLDTEFLIGGGYLSGVDVVAKFGRNPDIDTTSVPEDVWTVGGVYTGFPTGAAEEFQAFSSDASDTGTVYFEYLASATSTEWQTGSVVLQGTTPVLTGITGIRCHRIYYDNGSATTANAGIITLRHATTTANVFGNIIAGYGQSNQCVYTVPYGNLAIIKKIESHGMGSTSMQAEIVLWAREAGKSPRLLRSADVGTTEDYVDAVYGGLRFPALTDLAIRVLSVSANNSDISATMDVINVKI